MENANRLWEEARKTPNAAYAKECGVRPAGGGVVRALHARAHGPLGSAHGRDTRAAAHAGDHRRLAELAVDVNAIQTALSIFH
jgi:hypothetical protein